MTFVSFDGLWGPQGSDSLCYVYLRCHFHYLPREEISLVRQVLHQDLCQSQCLILCLRQSLECPKGP